MICEDCISYHIVIEESKTGLPKSAKKVCQFPETVFKRMTSEGVAECTGFAESMEDWDLRLQEAGIRAHFNKQEGWHFKDLMEYFFGECLDYNHKARTACFYPADRILLRGGK